MGILAARSRAASLEAEEEEEDEEEERNKQSLHGSFASYSLGGGRGNSQFDPSSLISDIGSIKVTQLFIFLQQIS